MKLHYIDSAKKTVEITEIKFGNNLLPVIANVRPAYITIDKKEFMGTQLTEKQVIFYFERLRKSLATEGKLYLEVANYV